LGEILILSKKFNDNDTTPKKVLIQQVKMNLFQAKLKCHKATIQRNQSH